MDIQKGGQALKEILKHDAESLKNSKLFSALIDDFLGGIDYRAESIVLKRAAESYVLRSLFESAEITADAAERAVEQFKRESRMTQEEAEFTVKCVIVARGGNPDILSGNTVSREAEEQRLQEEQRRREEQQRQEEQYCREEEQRRREEQQRQEEQYRREEEQRRREEQQRQEEQYRREEEARNQENAQEKKMAVVATGICVVIAVVILIIMFV